MDMSKKAYNSPERRKRREENYSVFSRDYHNLKNKEKEEKHEGMLKRDIIERNVKECPYCHGAVHRYEHILQCENCGAVGDLVTGIMVDMAGKENIAGNVSGEKTETKVEGQKAQK